MSIGVLMAPVRTNLMSASAHASASVAGLGTTLTSRAAAEAYVGGVCFKLGPPKLVGAELEWLTARDDDDCRGPAAPRPTLTELADALGVYAPASVASVSAARPLPHGSVVTIEPGGQIELSSAPRDSVEQLCRDLCADERHLRELLARRAISMHYAAADVHRAPSRLLDLPRYRAMEKYFAGIGGFGALMMCNTTAVQVSVDAGGDLAEVASRWRTLHMIGPSLLAAFATSPAMHGAPEGDWASQRMRAWLHLDSSRTRVPEGSDPVRQYAAWAMDVPLMCVRRSGSDWSVPTGATFADWLDGALDEYVGRRPDHSDLDYHLTTLFPLVRAGGHFEVRYLDAQPETEWTVPILAVDVLMREAAVAAEAAALAEPTAGRWLDAAEFGLRDPELRSAAEDLLELAAAHAADRDTEARLGAAARRCSRGVRPGEEAIA